MVTDDLEEGHASILSADFDGLVEEILELSVLRSKGYHSGEALTQQRLVALVRAQLVENLRKQADQLVRLRNSCRLLALQVLGSHFFLLLLLSENVTKY